MKRFRTSLFLPAFLVAFAALASGCGSCSKSSDDPSRSSQASPSASITAAPPPVPAPERLLGEAVLATPDATWKRLQNGIGGAAAILPNTFAGIVCAMAGLDPSAAREVDATAPAYAVVAEGEGGAFAFAVALKLTDGARTQTLLIDAETAPFSAKESDGVRVLAAKGLPLSFAVGVARSGYLLVASSVADLARLAPYAYRTLPTRAAGSSAIAIDVPRSALAGAIRARATAAWGGAKSWLLQQDSEQRSKHGGRAPDFGDASAIVACVDAAIERRLAIIGDLDGAHVEVDASDDAVHAVATLKPMTGSGAASQRFEGMHPGAAAPLLDAPSDATVAWIVRDDAAERASDAHDIEACVETALGKRIGDDDAKRLRAFSESWAKARGDWQLGSATWSATHGLAYRAPTADADAASRALRDAVDLARRPAFGDPLKRLFHVRDIAVTTTDAPPLGKISVATLARDEPPIDPKMKLPAPLPLGMAWTAANGEVSLAIGETPASLLAATAKPKSKLGDDARIAHAVGAFETNATFAFVAQPSARTAAPMGPPIVFAWGRRGHDGWARTEIGYATLRDLLRSFMSL